MSCAWNKAIHRKVEPRLHAIFIPSAQGRHPRGTSGLPLNAAWSPIWHGSQLPIAQDPPLNTEDRTQFVKIPPSIAGSTPAVADFRYRAPLNPRLVWPCFTAHDCNIHYVSIRPIYYNRFFYNLQELFKKLTININYYYLKHSFKYSRPLAIPSMQSSLPSNSMER